LSVTATASGTDIVLEWSPPADGITVNGYRIYRGETSGTYPTDLGTTTDNEFTDSNLDKGQTYYYQVMAFNDDGLGTPSEEVSATIQTTVPGVIDSLSAIRTFAQIELRWSAPDDDGGLAITQYSIYRSDSNTPPGTLLATQPGVGYIDSSNELGRTYYYWVRASNANGMGDWSNTATASPLAANPPGAPTNLAAVGGAGSVQVTWDAPTDNGSSDITEYRIYRATTDVKPDSPIHTNPGGVLSYTDSIDLMIGTTYNYWVTAYNSAGEGLPAGPASVLFASVPGVPTGLTATPGENTVTLNWTAPTDDGGAAITGYNIYRSETIVKPTSAIVNGGVSPYEDSSIESGKRYYYWVTAVNSKGESAASNRAMAALVEVPSPPTNLVATGGNGFISLTWNVPDDDGGGDITSYNVYRNNSAGILALLGTANDNSYTDNDVTTGVTYTYAIGAVNSAGEGAQSVTASTSPLIIKSTPSVPQNLKGEVQNGTVSLTWAAPNSDGGAPITQYWVYRGVIESNLQYIGSTTELTYNDTETSKGNSYYYAITAINEVGEGARTATLNVFVPLSSVPSVPLDLKAEIVNGNVLLSWSAPTSDGGGDVTGYKIYRGTSQATLSYITSVTGNSFEDTGRRDGVTYVYTVAAVNEAGDGPSASPVTITVPKESVVDSPVGLVAIAGLAVVGVGSVLFLLRRNRMNP